MNPHGRGLRREGTSVISHTSEHLYLPPLIVLPAFLSRETPDAHSLHAACIVDNPFTLL